MSLKETQEDLKRLCVGCGVCIGVCPVNAIKLERTNSALTVEFNRTLCVKCNKCVNLCPSLNNLSHNIPAGIGIIQKAFYGYSKDNAIRFHGASGGIATSLNICLLENVVDKVLIVKMNGFTVVPIIASDKNQIISSQGSIYFKTFSLSLLKELINDLSNGRRICFIGLPCQISALKKILVNFNDRIYFVGLICNHTNEDWYLNFIIKKCSVPQKNAMALSSRKNGWPGEVELTFSDGTCTRISQATFWGVIPYLGISSPLGCMFCTDHLSYDADLVLGDAWDPKLVKLGSSGISFVIARNLKGLDLLKNAHSQLFLEEISLSDVRKLTKHHVIEGARYASFRKKIFNLNFKSSELLSIDKFIIALLFITNRLAYRNKLFRIFLGTNLVQKILCVIHHLYILFRRPYDAS